MGMVLLNKGNIAYTSFSNVRNYMPSLCIALVKGIGNGHELPWHCLGMQSKVLHAAKTQEAVPNKSRALFPYKVDVPYKCRRERSRERAKHVLIRCDSQPVPPDSVMATFIEENAEQVRAGIYIYICIGLNS